MTRAIAAALALAAASALVAAVILVARSRAEPPARCAAGLVALGARCCGRGQRLDGDRCAGPPTACAAGMEVTAEGCVARARQVTLAGGLLRVGPGDWEAQGVVAPYVAEVAPFAIDALEVTEHRYARCVAARSPDACAALPLSGEPGRAVAGVTFDEAARFCAWAGGSLPTSDQLAFAAAGRSGRRYAWGDTGAVCRRATWGIAAGPCGFGGRGPELAGSHPDGASPDGVLDLAGNVAEWARPVGEAPIVRLTHADVRGGSFADGSAGALRSWQRRSVPSDTRSPEVGFRCGYPAGAAARDR